MNQCFKPADGPSAQALAQMEGLDLLARPRLSRLFDQDPQRPVVLCAPAGFGKSVAVYQEACRLAQPCCAAWVDASSPTFFRLLMDAVSPCRALGIKRGVVIVDGIGELSSGDALRFVTFATACASEGLRLLVTTRDERYRGLVPQALELGARDLLVTDEDLQGLSVEQAAPIGSLRMVDRAAGLCLGEGESRETVVRQICLGKPADASALVQSLMFVLQRGEVGDLGEELAQAAMADSDRISPLCGLERSGRFETVRLSGRERSLALCSCFVCMDGILERSVRIEVVRRLIRALRANKEDRLAFLVKAMEDERAPGAGIMRPTMTVSLLGKFGIHVSDGVNLEQVVIRDKAKAFFAILAFNQGKALSREWLSQAMWPDKSGPAQRQSLYSMLSYLKKTVDSAFGSEALLADRTTIMLKVDGIRVDATLLMRICENVIHDEGIRMDDRQLLVRFKRLGRGELMPGFDEPVLDAARQKLSRRIADALMHQAEKLIASKDLHLANEYLEFAGTVEPLREDLCCLRAEALHALGRSADALNLLYGYRVTMRDEYGLGCSKRFMELYERILRESSWDSSDGLQS